jgi:hypothetical protein
LKETIGDSGPCDGCTVESWRGLQSLLKNWSESMNPDKRGLKANDFIGVHLGSSAA